jgi:type IV pilus assembly protein PilC
MQFTYKATNKEGHSVSGTAEVADRQALLTLLRKQGLHPIVIEASKGKSKSSGLFKPKKKVKLSELVIFTRQLSTMISAGVPLARSLAALQDNAESPYFKEVLAGITKEVESGSSLGDSFAKYPRVFRMFT